ncbi:DUF4198 domain-containing protein [Fertoebacter nigrum]|uniref:DUF4198 domain-containing protein n=1 Tax=Fertoeibacter niger TaxID=2656921 RepID=A0A8X8GZT0_9RHOB|nr:DUF4198 domain-containing protein [Fertoeibacter niger]NUB46167.1 DUF4198 domain-containing protein [Fertoeibacter niger]
MRVLSLCLFLVASSVSAHEFWIEPLDYQPEVGGSLRANLLNGEMFEGQTFGFLPDRSRVFVVVAGDKTIGVTNRIGNLPAVDQPALGDGLHVVVYQSVNNKVSYATYEKFEPFVLHKDFSGIRERHAARGLPETDFAELYTRFSKSLIGVGSGAGADRFLGLETEIVALNNPYTDDPAQGMHVQVFYRNSPRADVQVELYARGADGVATVTKHRTDAEGIALLPVARGMEYMVDAVVLREPEPSLAQATGTVWESLWANLTFRVPD